MDRATVVLNYPDKNAERVQYQVRNKASAGPGAVITFQNPLF